MHVVQLFRFLMSFVSLNLLQIADGTVKMAEDEFIVEEYKDYAEVCVEISGLPDEGLENELTVTLTIINGTNTGNCDIQTLNIMLVLLTYVQLNLGLFYIICNYICFLIG